MSTEFPSLAFELKQFINVVRREGPVVAWHKGVRYLKYSIPARFRRLRVLRAERVEDRFTIIHRTKMRAGVESLSGPAASLASTERLRQELPGLFERLDVKTVFDAPCGDFHWMQHVVRNCPVDYIGGDIVKPLIEANNARFDDARRRFVHIDVSRESVPRTDLWICRGLFSTLSDEDSLSTLRLFVGSGTPFILLSSHANPAGRPNVDIKSGDSRYVDLFAPPFNLPPAILRVEDRPGDEDMYLWSREQVADAIGNAGKQNG